MPIPISAMPVPSPKSAVTIGSPIARKEPKLISRTTTAARTPIPAVALGGVNSVCWIACPSSSTSSRSERMLVARAITFLIADSGRTLARWSKRTVAKPIVLSFEMRLAGLRVVRAGHAGHVRQAGDCRQHRPDRGADAGIGQRAGARPEDDLIRVAGLGRKAALEQVDGALRAGAAEREVARVVAAEALPGRADADENDDPEHDDAAAMRRAPAGESEHRPTVAETGGCLRFWYAGAV